jgi:hypothetical protein
VFLIEVEWSPTQWPREQDTGNMLDPSDGLAIAFILAVLVASMGRTVFVTAVRSLNRLLWSEDLSPVPRRKLMTLLVAAEVLLPFLVAGATYGAMGLQESLGWTNPASRGPLAVLALVLVTLPAYGLFLSLALKTSIARGLAIQAMFMAATLAGWGLLAAVSAGAMFLLSGLRTGFR